MKKNVEPTQVMYLFDKTEVNKFDKLIPQPNLICEYGTRFENGSAQVTLSTNTDFGELAVVLFEAAAKSADINITH